MNESRARWAALYWPLVLNVIGWAAIYFLFAGLLQKQPEKPPNPELQAREAQGQQAQEARARAMEAQLATLTASTQRISDQLDALDRQRRAPGQTDDIGRRLSQAQLAKLESATARLEDELGSLRQRTHVTVDLNVLVQSLRPNVSFGVLRVDPRKPGEIDLTFQMRNLGPYMAMIEAPDIVVATKPIPQSGPIDGQLVLGKDYAFRAVRAGALLPSEPKNHAYTIVLNDPRKMEHPLYYRMNFKTTTDPTVVGASTRLLHGKLPEKEIQELSAAHYSHIGEVAVVAR
jgi:hypothetical protein